MVKKPQNAGKKVARIFIDQEDYDFIMKLKDEENVSLQTFVSTAIQDRVFRMRYQLAVEEELNKNN